YLRRRRRTRLHGEGQRRPCVERPPPSDRGRGARARGRRPPPRGNGVGLPRSLLGNSPAAFAGTLCELRYRPAGSARFALGGELLAGPEQLPAPHPHSPGGRRGGGDALRTIEDADKPDLLIPVDDPAPDAHGGELLGGTRRRQERTSARDP